MNMSDSDYGRYIGVPIVADTEEEARELGKPEQEGLPEPKWTAPLDEET